MLNIVFIMVFWRIFMAGTIAIGLLLLTSSALLFSSEVNLDFELRASIDLAESMEEKVIKYNRFREAKIQDLVDEFHGIDPVVGAEVVKKKEIELKENIIKIMNEYNNLIDQHRSLMFKVAVLRARKYFQSINFEIDIKLVPRNGPGWEHKIEFPSDRIDELKAKILNKTYYEAGLLKGSEFYYRPSNYVEMCDWNNFVAALGYINKYKNAPNYYLKRDNSIILQYFYEITNFQISRNIESRLLPIWDFRPPGLISDILE